MVSFYRPSALETQHSLGVLTIRQITEGRIIGVRDRLALTAVRSYSLGQLSLPHFIASDEGEAKGQEDEDFEAVGYEHGSLFGAGGEGQ